MGNLLFLLIAVVLSGIGILVVLARHRGPTGMSHGVDSFTRQMRAIAPDESGADGTPGSGPPPGPDGPGARR